jgi:methylthioribulose-1-phosphate dehydratase
MHRYLSFFLLAPLALPAALKDAAEEIVQVGIELHKANLCPATSGNFSLKIDENLIAITVSGKHKGHLTTDDVLLVNLEGIPQETSKRPSAETLLHTMLYTLYPDLGAVVHTHSANAIVLSRLLVSQSHLMTEGYEIHKIFDDIHTHDSTFKIPIFENSQDMVALAAEIAHYLKQHPITNAFLLRGHGMYTWGRTMNETMYRVEALEHLFECELKVRTQNK